MLEPHMLTDYIADRQAQSTNCLRRRGLPTARRRVLRTKRGSVILITAWALLLLAFSLTAWLVLVDARIRESNVNNRQLEARAAARSGLELAMHPQIEPYSDILKVIELGPNQSCTVVKGIEAARIHLNFMLTQAQQDEEARAQLSRFFEELGLELQERDILIDSMLDWVDPDNLARPNGMEDGVGYAPPNRFFESLEEVERVNGAEALRRIPAWWRFFTLWSRGPIDINWAPVEILRALPGIGDVEAEAIIMRRDGPDGLAVTEDDEPIRNAAELRSLTGLSEQEVERLGRWITFNANTARIESVGQSGDYRLTISVAARLSGPRPIILDWQEY